MPPDVFIRERGGARVVLGDPALGGDAPAHLAIDLDHEFDGVGRGLPGVEGGPGAALDGGERRGFAGALRRLENRVLMAEPLPEFFGQMRREGRDQKDQRLDRKSVV